MPGAGTDKTRRWLTTPAPVVVLVEPQLGENIGSVARAMANFGLSQLRLVKPVQGWPNERAKVMAAGADRVLDAAVLYDSLADAIGDCTVVVATTARVHDQSKPVVSAEAAAKEMAPRIAAGETAALVFGRERSGLENDEVGQADRILTLPVNPAFASLNLGQAVIIVAYEWFKLTGSGMPFATAERSPPAQKEQLAAFFANLEKELEKVEFFRPEEKRGVMRVNLRNIFQRIAPTQQDVRTLHGVVNALAHGRKGSARGGVLDGDEASRLRRRRSMASARRGVSPNSCAGTRPRLSAGSGERSPPTAALPAAASSGKCRSARRSPISYRFRCARSSISCRRRSRLRRSRAAPRSAPGSRRTTTRSSPCRRTRSSAS